MGVPLLPAKLVSSLQGGVLSNLLSHSKCEARSLSLHLTFARQRTTEPIGLSVENKLKISNYVYGYGVSSMILTTTSVGELSL